MVEAPKETFNTYYGNSPHMVSQKLLFFSPYDKLGKIYRIPHYNSHRISMTRLLRRHWLIDTPKGKRQNTARFIVGECSLIQNVNEGLNEGYRIEIVTGPKIRDSETREKLATLLEKYGSERLRVFAVATRPERHSALINGNILYEDIHLADEDYDEATVIENADNNNVTLLLNRFNSLMAKGDFKNTPEKIRSMETLH